MSDDLGRLIRKELDSWGVDLDHDECDAIGAVVREHCARVAEGLAERWEAAGSANAPAARMVATAIRSGASS